MKQPRFSRLIQVTMGLLVVALMTAGATAANLIISTGSSAGQSWTWHQTSALPGAMYSLVMSEAEAKVLAGQLPAHMQADAFKGIDFSRQAALVAYLGEAPTGGYAVEFDSIQINDQQMWVNINRRSPAADEAVIMMATYPIAVRPIALSDLPKHGFTVRFADQTGKLLAEKSIVEQKPANTAVTLKLGKDSMLNWQWSAGKQLNGSVYALVTSEKEAKAVTAQLPKSLQKYAFKNVNFKKQAALIAYLGEAPNGEYAVDLHSVTISGKQMMVKVARRSPAQKYSILPVATYPMVVKTLPLSQVPAKPFTVQFVDQTGQKLAEAVAGVKTIYHKVQAGQTLWYISWLYDVKMADLLRWNGLTATSVLQPGQVLRVFVSQ